MTNVSSGGASRDDATRLATIVRRFGQFAAAYPDLRLYRAICEGAARDREVAELLLAASPGQERPVLLLAALHDLVLRSGGGGIPAARWYASVVGRDGLPEPEAWGEPGGGPWPDVRRALLRHRDEITRIIATRSTQTNEVNRAVYVLAMLALTGATVVDSAAGSVVGGSHRPGGEGHDAGLGEPAPLPVALVELGCSAGLLLTPDRYDVRITGGPASVWDAAATSAGGGRVQPSDVRIVRWGDPDSAVRLEGEDRTPAEYGPVAARGLLPPPIVARVGLDLAPVHPDDADDADELRWLHACLWPDVPGRVERFEAAVAQRRGEVRAGRGDVELRTGDITDPMAVTQALQAAVRRAEAAGHPTVTFDDRAAFASGPRDAGSGPRAAGSGPRAAGSGPRAAGSGVPAAGSGPRDAGSGPRDAGSGVPAPGSTPRASGSRPGMPVVRPALHIVAVTSWAATYVERSRRERIAGALGGFAVSTGLPVTWCGAEPAGSMPGLGDLPDGLLDSSPEGVTVLAARRWRAGRELPPIVWGIADPHGRWIRLRPR